MSKVADKLKALQKEMHVTGYKEIERLARKILKENPELEGFCMAMGSATFYQKEGWVVENGEEVHRDRVVDDNDPRIKEMEEFVCMFNSDYFIITGSPMKIDKWDGPLITDW